MEANKTHGEKVRQKLHKNAASYLEQIPEANFYKRADVWLDLPSRKPTK